MQEKYDDKFFKDNYLYLGNYTYSQFTISSLIKVYTNNKNDRLRAFFQAGFFLLSPNKDITGLDLGCGVIYKIYEDAYISLTRKFLIGKFDFGGGDRERMPNSVLINFNYKLNW